MARGVVAGERNIHARKKVKTGCATCRIRKVKCDEQKPQCQKCVKTGRTCDGYDSPFRFCTNQSTKNVRTDGIKSDPGLQPIRPTSIEITPQEIDLLNRYFSIKTVFDVKLDCDAEAKQVLQASLTDAPIQHAVLALRALREDFEKSGNSSASAARQTTSSYNYGLEQYNMALRGLASNLSSSPSSNSLRSALLCCQIFMSIEQVQENYAAMAQHIIRGLRIMREYRTRPVLTAANTFEPAHHDQLPLLDVFIIKLFAAPCKFTDPSVTPPDLNGTSSPAESSHLRTIAPDMRTELTRIATSTLKFLDKVSRVELMENALQLLPEKAVLLDSLGSWLVNLELVQTETGPPGPETISVSFMHILHLVQKIVLLGTLNSSPDLDAELQTECDRLQSVADSLGERLRALRTSGRTS